MMTNEELRENLLMQYDEEVVNGMTMFTSPSYAAAVVAVTHDDRLVYDYNKMVECLMVDDGMTYEEAAEFIDYNTIRTLPYMEKPPVIIMPLEFNLLERELVLER